MFSYFANIVVLFASAVQQSIAFASSIGHVLVILITTITSIIYNSLKSILLFFQIVYEDNITLFSEDLPNSVSDIIEAINYQWSYLHSGILIVLNEATYKCMTTLSSIKWSMQTIFVVIYEVLCIVMKTVIFFGDSLWLVITFVPIHLPFLLKEFIKYLKDALIDYVVDAYMLLLKVTNFLSDVPLESFIGIMTTMIIVRSCIHFHEVIQSQMIAIYWILVRKIRYLYYAIYNYFTDSEVRRITRIVNGESISTSRNMDIHLESDNDDDPANAADALCVICQERQKCVLTLPCRHVCLCTECCRRLYGYQRTCPICRTFIYHSVTVYL